ncbi:MAG TPA: siderophore-interacting protein [Mesorhizobium sp.]|jgi:NADPH-dependent ferric siderophore reductase|uniref:siderophore-interacting protein n=1 Tax=Mesorhizobium sp. TaxID=1871066 RepID=UPI002DDD1D8E|nr:siderophore-interacting protein [Mesorhizobium sp.]HEV2504004.1 siderophore-interacting protein [Mesorhizobium sp.]
MNVLNCEARLQLPNLERYLHLITDRVMSFDARMSRNDERVDFRFAFGEAAFEMKRDLLVLRAGAGERDGLARIKDILATAVEIYARQDEPEIVWTGDLAGDTRLAQFREMTVIHVADLTPHMRRIRLAGEDLARFGKFQGMHIRILFPTATVPDPVWPSLGANGLPLWPSDERRPTARVYTIRAFDLEAGHMDVDFLIHEGESVGSAWAMQARAGHKVGIMGPVGRPVRPADWCVLGADETGLPAVGRLLETLPPQTRGVAFVEIADGNERQQINNVTQIELHWLERNGKAPGMDGRLAEQVLSVQWPGQGTAFGWFAAEAEAARLVRTTWRDQMGLGRDQTIAAAYWRRGQAGLMAG